MKAFLRILISVLIFFGTSIGRADDMSVFLKSCAYGTAAGAVIGLAGLALSENPSEKTNMVARGASLGLYAGIGFGLYTLYGPQRGQTEFANVKNPLWISPVSLNQKIVGAQVNWANFSF